MRSDRPEGRALPRRPLLLLDIDGVISLFGFPPHDPPPGRFHAIEGVPHFLSATAPGALMRLAGAFDLVWASGWEDRANDHLPHLLGLPGPLPFLKFDRASGLVPSASDTSASDTSASDTSASDTSASDTNEADTSEADSSEPSPDGRGQNSTRAQSSMRAHWKLDAIDAYAAKRALAWVDDAFDDSCERWAAARAAPTLLLSTQPAVGLTAAHADRLLAFATR